MSSLPKILFIIGSHRKSSFSHQVADYVQRQLEGLAECVELDYDEVPFFNQDVEFPTPAPVAQVRAEIEKADGLWIMTPEYNRSYPGLLKNLIDWLSRPVSETEGATRAIRGKRVAVTAATGSSKGSGVIPKLAELLQFVRAEYVNDAELGLQISAESFKTGVLALDEETEAALNTQISAFLHALTGEAEAASSSTVGE